MVEMWILLFIHCLLVIRARCDDLDFRLLSYGGKVFISLLLPLFCVEFAMTFMKKGVTKR
jgi:hypothetical protein